LIKGQKTFKMSKGQMSAAYASWARALNNPILAIHADCSRDDEMMCEKCATCSIRISRKKRVKRRRRDNDSAVVAFKCALCSMPKKTTLSILRAPKFKKSCRAPALVKVAEKMPQSVEIVGKKKKKKGRKEKEISAGLTLPKAGIFKSSAGKLNSDDLRRLLKRDESASNAGEGGKFKAFLTR
jgi:hypothetical protein